MKYTFLILLLFLSQSYAQAPKANHCRQINPITTKFNENDIISILAKIKDCPTDDQEMLSKVKQDFDAYYGEDRVRSAYIKGYMLKGPSSMFSTARKMLGAKRPDGWKEAASDCETILCAFTKLLKSEKAAMQIFNFKKKSGYYLSLDQTLNDNMGEQIWSAKEVQELDAAVDKLPKHLRNMKLDKIQRYADGLRESTHNANVAAYASPVPELVFYDAGAKGSPTGKNSYTSTSWPQEVLLHELCHHYDFKNFHNTGSLISETRGSIFGKLSGWKEKKTKGGEVDWKHNHDAKFVSNYASSSPAEDYAESCMNYILHPHKLEQKSPEKYNYMKKYVFKKQEFKQEPWTNKDIPVWQGLEDQIAEEKGCIESVSACLKSITYSGGNYCVVGGTYKIGTSSTSWHRCEDVAKIIQGDSCVKDVKANIINEITEELGRSEDLFCDYGGIGTVQKRKDDICNKSIVELSQKLDKANEMDLTPLIQDCEQNDDFTKQCVIDKVQSKINVSGNKEAIKLINKVVNAKVSDRMTALGNKLSQKQNSLWFKACLKSVGSIEHYKISSSNTGEYRDTYRYVPIDDAFGTGFLGSFIYKDYKRDDINMDCANEVVKVLKESGVKTPKTGSPVNLMQDHFIKELRSFERDVLLVFDDSIKKCLFIKRCKLKKVRALVKAWEAKSPELRKGMASDDFIEELFNKAKPKF
jgi:hypothetical protein